eukprot:TRINITY_DN808_c0_g1_i1.p1 TRINITY_DN808_c0_g1~~TRINITY_DN808_c0_g1_i1.p1  ORF type:complete len:488 (-),score=117.75 TRINITY_DN808_c0_g1_i1:128-1591(-)
MASVANRVVLGPRSQLRLPLSCALASRFFSTLPFIQPKRKTTFRKEYNKPVTIYRYRGQADHAELSEVISPSITIHEPLAKKLAVPAPVTKGRIIYSYSPEHKGMELKPTPQPVTLAPNQKLLTTTGKEPKYHVLNVNVRFDKHRGANKRAQEMAQVPINVFGTAPDQKGQNYQHFWVDLNDIQRELRDAGALCRMFKFNIVGNEKNATANALREKEKDSVFVIQDVKVDPLTFKPQHVQFKRFFPGVPMKVTVPVKFHNADACEGVKQGGLLLYRKHSLTCWFVGNAMPSAEELTLHIDCTYIGSGARTKSVRLSDLKLVPGLMPTKNVNHCFITLYNAQKREALSEQEKQILSVGGAIGRAQKSQEVPEEDEDYYIPNDEKDPDPNEDNVVVSTAFSGSDGLYERQGVMHPLAARFFQERLPYFVKKEDVKKYLAFKEQVSKVSEVVKKLEKLPAGTPFKSIDGWQELDNLGVLLGFEKPKQKSS